MKILIFGSTNWIAKLFINFLNNTDDNIYIIETNVKPDNEILVDNIIMAHSPTHIITFVDNFIEQSENLFDNIKDNLYSHVVLAYLSSKYKIHFTYIGNAFLYNRTYPNEYEYLENDNPDFFGSSYFIIKAFTDKIIKLYSNVLNLRIKMPIYDYHHPSNFITKIINYNKICSLPNSISVLNDIFPILLDMMINKYIGTFNLTNPGTISHNEILELYKKIIDPSLIWTNISIDEENKLFTNQRYNNKLSNKKLLKLYPNIPNIKISVKNLLIKMKNNIENDKIIF